MKTSKKRRKEAKTDYGKRIKLLKSSSPRIVFRKTNKYVIIQYVISKEAKDEIEFGITSKINKIWVAKRISGKFKINYCGIFNRTSDG